MLKCSTPSTAQDSGQAVVTCLTVVCQASGSNLTVTFVFITTITVIYSPRHGLHITA